MTNGATAKRAPLARGALLAVAILPAIGMALALAWFMHFLIHSSEMRLSESDRAQMLDFVRVKRSESAERKDRKPQRPQVSQAPDAPAMAEQASSSQPLTIAVEALASMASDVTLDAGYGAGVGDGDYLPIVKVAPIYPRNALVRGQTGECLVRYTVTTAGTVTNVEVIEEQCLQAMFRRPSIEAARRFKYKPRVIDGVAIEVHGVRNMFYFESADGGGPS